MAYDFIPYVSITPRRLSMYHVCQNKRSRSHDVNFLSDSKDFNKPQGLISKKAKENIETAVDWLLYLADEKKSFCNKKGSLFKFKATFITLTLSSEQIHSDNEIKASLLNQFLIEAKKKWHISNYIWRAESQHNGNIHFHILCDKFVPWAELRYLWNRIQNKLGYTDRYHSNMKSFHRDGFQKRPDLTNNIYHKGRLIRKGWSIEDQRKAYKHGIETNWYDPNSTDIHSIKFINDLGRYLSKICSQNLEPVGAELSKKINKLKFSGEIADQFRKIDGKLWGLSNFLSQCKKIVIEVNSNMGEELNNIKSFFKNKVFECDYATVVNVKIEEWSNYIKSELWECLFEHIKSISIATRSTKLSPISI